MEARCTLLGFRNSKTTTLWSQHTINPYQRHANKMILNRKFKFRKWKVFVVINLFCVTIESFILHTHGRPSHHNSKYIWLVRYLNHIMCTKCFYRSVIYILTPVLSHICTCKQVHVWAHKHGRNQNLPTNTNMYTTHNHKTINK